MTATVSNYAELLISKADEELHFWFLKKLWLKLETCLFNPADAMISRRILWFSQSYLTHIPQDNFSEWNVVDDIYQFPSCMPFVLGGIQVFQKLPEQAQGIVINKLLERGKTNPKTLEWAVGLLPASNISEHHKSLILDSIKSAELSHIAGSGIALPYYAPKIIEDLKSHNWYKQSPAIGHLKAAGPDKIALLPVEIQMELGRNVLQSAEGSSIASYTLIYDIANEEKKWPDAFIKGIIFECFVDDDNKIRFKPRSARYAIQCAPKTTGETQDAILDELIGLMEISELKRPHFMCTNRQDILSEISTVRNECEELSEKMDALHSIITRRVPSDNEPNT